jgi:hypothetical protein|tara:strand:+ start:375 stop:506 length:132 start_codon:yes stop_codon:yes gene_type:complete
MSKNTAKQIYTQTLEWLKSRGIKVANTNRKKSRFNNYKEKRRK